MANQEQVIERMARAVRPSLFDAACEPELLFAMVLSNLMSPSLWAFRETVEHAALALHGDGRIESLGDDLDAGDPEALLMDAIQHEVNDHFFHVAPLDIEDIWGVVDLEEERARLGRRCIDDAIRVIVEEINSREAHGEAMDRIDVRPLIEQGIFPEYTYPTLDVLRAERRILKRKKHKPAGITCCADEAMLICSLAAVLHGIALDEIVILGSVAHYTAFLRHGRCSSWFNGKREYFFKDSWARQCTPSGSPRGPDSQDQFDARLISFDRIITPSGSYLLHDGVCTIAPERLQAIEAELADFFGVELRQLREAHARPRQYLIGPLTGFSFAPLDRLDDAAEIAKSLRAMAAARPGTILEGAFYAFRDLSVRHPEAYVRAALREHKARHAAEAVRTLEDAVAIVRAIEGCESIFDTRERISLPDEVLMLRTGSDRDKALLLYALIQHAPSLSPADKRAAEILFTEQDSFVQVGGGYVSTRTFERCERIEQPVTLRLAAS